MSEIPDDIRAATFAICDQLNIMKTSRTGKITHSAYVIASALLAERNRCEGVMAAEIAAEHVRCGREKERAIAAERQRILREIAEFNDWQPIETAPKDGTAILVGHEGAVFSAWWEKDGHNTSTNQPGWIDGSTNRYEEYTTYEPTHWQPLPAPPSPSSPLPSGEPFKTGRGE